MSQQHMTVAEYKKYLNKRSKPNKYRNVKVIIDDIEFDSTKEADRYAGLKFMERAGIIQDLQLQVKFELYPTHKSEGVTIRGKSYIADFVYTKDGEQVVEDVKGFRTKEYKRKKKMMLERYGIEIVEA